MNLIKSLNKFHFAQCLCQTRRAFFIRFFSSYSKSKKDNESDQIVIDEEAIINERNFDNINVEQFADLASNEEQQSDIESILSHYEHKKYSTMEVPTTLSRSQMKNLLEMDNWRHRDKYLIHLYRREVSVIISKKFKSDTKAKNQQLLKDKYRKWNTGRTGIFSDNGDIIYGLWHNSLFTRISPQYIGRLIGNRLKTSAIFEQKILIDMTSDPSMSYTQCASKLKQLMNTYQTNRRLSEPFDLNYCNLDFNGIIWKTMQKQMPFYSSLPYFMSSFSQNSYLDLCDRKSLVYLTPMATKDLEYDSNKTYIISFCDGFDQRIFNQMAARKEYIQLRRLPIDKHVFWSGHTKDLKSYTVLKIMNDVRQGIDWQTAIQNNVNPDFIKPIEQVEREDSYRWKRKQRQSIDVKQNFSEN